MHGVPSSIVFNRDTKFLSHFLRCLRKLLGIKLLFSTTCYPQTDGQIEVTNGTLSTLLRGLMSKNFKEWDLKLPHTKFAYKRALTYATSDYPFETCYRANSLTPIELLPLLIEHRVSFEAHERTNEMKKLLEQIHAQIEKVSASYKARANKHRKTMAINSGDLVWLHVRKE